MPLSDAQRDHHNAYRREWRDKNAERLSAQRKARYAATKDEVRGYQRDYYEKNRPRLIARAMENKAARADDVRAYAREWAKQRRLKTPAYYLLLSARARARRRGLPCTLLLSDIVIPAFCPVLGIPIVPGSQKFHPGSPSLDRIDNAGGYTPANVRVISHRANTLKRDMTLEEARLVVANWTAR